MDFLVIDDDPVFREAVCLLIEEEGHYAEGAANPEAGLDALREGKFDAVFLDLYIGRDNGLQVLPTILKLRPKQAVVMFSAQGTIKTAVQAIRQGAADFLEKPFTREQFNLLLARLKRLGELGKKIEHLEEQVKESRAEQPEVLIDFEAPAMQTVMDMLRRAAASPASVLILGETGTGKSIAARVLHAHSPLANKPFVTVSCPSLSRELLESTLFGHVRGSFTGALRDCWGKVKAADGGTLFLDEIGDLPLDIQPKLLRLLQEREYERVGDTVTCHAEVRIVAATNRDLRRRVAEGLFREDLFYRLNVISLHMPPLRERPHDVLRFATHYLNHCAARCGRRITGFTPAAERLLYRYPWPGNLRELHNIIERAVILTRSDRIDAVDFATEMRRAADPAIASGLDDEGGLRAGSMVSLAQIEEQHIRRVLESSPSLNAAADILGIDQATIYRKRKKMAVKAKAGDGMPTPSPDLRS